MLQNKHVSIDKHFKTPRRRKSGSHWEGSHGGRKRWGGTFHAWQEGNVYDTLVFLRARVQAARMQHAFKILVEGSQRMGKCGCSASSEQHADTNLTETWKKKHTLPDLTNSRALFPIELGTKLWRKTIRFFFVFFFSSKEQRSSFLSSPISEDTLKLTG